MEQLSGVDNASLFAERRNVYNHVASLLIYDVTTAPGGEVRFKDILRHFKDRLHLHPVFSRHLVNAPLGLDRPYWVADTDIDVEYHIRHIALPKPGDWRQLMIQVARLHSRPLDRARPLWEAYVIEGLDNIPKLPPGAFAVFLKIHHAAVDGMAAIHLMSQLHTATPEDDGVGEQLGGDIAESPPSTYEFLSRRLMNNFGMVASVARISTKTASRMISSGKEQLAEIIESRSINFSEMVAKLKPEVAPETRFSGQVSPNRVIEGFGMPLSRIKRIRSKVAGSTLNDVFISVGGGASRKYLESKGELPEASLSGLMPISLRVDGSSGGGNEVAVVPVRVRSDIADPIERLLAVSQETKNSKAKAEKMGLDLIKNVFDILPPVAANLMLDNLMTPSINMTVSNVRGPDKPMFLAGAKAMCLYPVSIPSDGVGLNFTGVSYNGVMWVSSVSCRKMVPDPGFLLSCMEEAWQELLAAADKLPDPEVAEANVKKTVTKGKTKKPSAKAKTPK